jgi:hypothetical protein
MHREADVTESIEKELSDLADDLARVVVENYQGDEPLSIEAIVKQFESPALNKALAQLIQLGEIGQVDSSALNSQEQQTLKAFVEAAAKPDKTGTGLLAMLAKKHK